MEYIVPCRIEVMLTHIELPFDSLCIIVSSQFIVTYTGCDVLPAEGRKKKEEGVATKAAANKKKRRGGGVASEEEETVMKVVAAVGRKKKKGKNGEGRCAFFLVSSISILFIY